jgi:pSer/pThr/pTyr-binding forkhead associated (FHA) protein
MSDTRLDSIHLEFPRRDRFRLARQQLLGARGCLTIAGERVGDWLGFDGGASAEPILPGDGYYLFDEATGEAYALHTGLNTIGRFDNNDIVLAEKYVSRRHCTILVHARGSCELHDTASRNGTFVNKRRVDHPIRLSAGDRICICNHRLILTRGDDVGAADDADDTHYDLPNALGDVE